MPSYKSLHYTQERWRYGIGEACATHGSGESGGCVCELKTKLNQEACSLGPTPIYIPKAHVSSSEGGALRAVLPIAAEALPRERSRQGRRRPPDLLLEPHGDPAGDPPAVDRLCLRCISPHPHTHRYGRLHVPTAASCARSVQLGSCEADADHRRDAREVALEAEIGMACSS